MQLVFERVVYNVFLTLLEDEVAFFMRVILLRLAAQRGLYDVTLRLRNVKFIYS